MLPHISHDTPASAPRFAPSLIHRCATSKPRVAAYNPAGPIIEAKRIDGKPAHRVEGSPLGAWIVANTEIDAMLNRVIAQLNCSRTAIYDATGMHAGSVTRCRQGAYILEDQWVLRLGDFSGIPVAELRQVACMEPVTQPHPKARRVV